MNNKAPNATLNDMKKLVFPFLLFVVMMANGQTVLTDQDLASGIGLRTINGRISVHDPSAVWDNVTNPSSPRVLIYGSHLGAATTTPALNYQRWTGFGGGEWNCTLFTNTNGTRVGYANAYSTHLITRVRDKNGNWVTFGNFDAHAWQHQGDNVQGNQWAADIIYNPTMGKWLMYMSLNGDKWGASIVCFVSNNAEGPWTYQGPVVFSGFQGTFAHNGFAAANDYLHTDLQIALGSLSALPARYNVGNNWGQYWPNAIDPCVFFDEQGRFWMSYGSWSGGIFMFQLDKTTGLRDYTITYPYQINLVNQSLTAGASQDCNCDPYFGIKIAGGYYVSGEASYIKHIGNHYYLFMTYGGLTATGGYQMRVFRGTAPEGPYVDCLNPSGISALYGKYILNYGGDAKRDEGVKLMAGYQWTLMPKAEVAQGHNSVMIDGQGRTLLFYHTRFNDGTEGHEVRARQLFLTADGWLVASPYEFSGETVTDATIASTQLYSAQEVAGDYQFMAHPYRQNTAALAVERPVNIRLNPNGTVTGDYTGSWSLTNGTSYITLTLSGQATAYSPVTFTGVLTRQTIDYSNIHALCFTALSTSSGAATTGGAALQTRGLSIWGSKAEPRELIPYALSLINIPEYVASDLNLPTGYMGATYTWTSSNPNVITNDGKVKGGGRAYLTLTITKDGYTYTTTYPIITASDGAAYYPTCGAKDYSNAFWTTFSDKYMIRAGQSCSFHFYNYTKGEENWQNWMLYGCTDLNGTNMTGERFGIRADNWDNTTTSNTGCTSNYNWDTFKSDMHGAKVDIECSLSTAGQFNMAATITTRNGRTYTYNYTKTLSDRPAQLMLVFQTEASYIGQEVPDGGEYYPICDAVDFSNAYWTTFSDNYLLLAGSTANFHFYNYTKGEENWQNWMLFGCDKLVGTDMTGQRFGIRADNWDNTSGSNTGCTSNYNWDTFKNDMNGARVDMSCTLSTTGQFTMTSIITTESGKTLNYSYTKMLSDNPSQLILVFLTEASYIGGGNLDFNQDGEITLADLTTAVNYLSGRIKTTPKVRPMSNHDIEHIVNYLTGR